jgi:hypothetical protein
MKPMSPGSLYTLERRELHIEFWLGNLKGRECLETYVDGKIILKSILRYVLRSCALRAVVGKVIKFGVQ